MAEIGSKCVKVSIWLIKVYSFLPTNDSFSSVFLKICLTLPYNIIYKTELYKRSTDHHSFRAARPLTAINKVAHAPNRINSRQVATISVEPDHTHTGINFPLVILNTLLHRARPEIGLAARSSVMPIIPGRTLAFVDVAAVCVWLIALSKNETVQWLRRYYGKLHCNFCQNISVMCRN